MTNAEKGKREVDPKSATNQRPPMDVRTCAMDGELLPPHELVDELRDQLLGVLVGTVHVVSSRDDHRKLERPEPRREPEKITAERANSERQHDE